MLWSCRLHNEVNEKLNLPQHPCNVDELDLRWRKGDSHCEISLNHETDELDDDEGKLKLTNE